MMEEVTAWQYIVNRKNQIGMPGFVSQYSVSVKYHQVWYGKNDLFDDNCMNDLQYVHESKTEIMGMIISFCNVKINTVSFKETIVHRTNQYGWIVWFELNQECKVVYRHTPTKKQWVWKTDF